MVDADCSSIEQSVTKSSPSSSQGMPRPRPRPRLSWVAWLYPVVPVDRNSAGSSSPTAPCKMKIWTNSISGDWLARRPYSRAVKSRGPSVSSSCSRTTSARVVELVRRPSRMMPSIENRPQSPAGLVSCQPPTLGRNDTCDTKMPCVASNVIGWSYIVTYGSSSPTSSYACPAVPPASMVPCDAARAG